MQTAGPRLRIFVDADACPVKDEVYRVAARHGLTVFVVANSPIMVPRAPEIERIVVGAGPDAADDWIAERAGAGAIVVTSDIPLASRLTADASSRAPTSSRRTETLQRKRDRHGASDARPDGPPALDRTADIGARGLPPRDRSNFLSALDNAVVRLQRLAMTR